VYVLFGAPQKQSFLISYIIDQSLIVSLRTVEAHSLLGVMNFGYYIGQPIWAHCALENALSTSQLM